MRRSVRFRQPRMTVPFRKGLAKKTYGERHVARISRRDGVDSLGMSMISNDAHRRSRDTSSQFVSIHCRGNAVRAVISGPRLGQRESQIVAREIHDVIEEAGHAMKHLVLDLTDVRTISSLGLGMCIDVRNEARKHGAETFVIGLSLELAGLFRIMKVDRLYVIVQDEDELRARLAG